ncbi:MAG: polymer-forming cytoskeletal protein [Anaerolineae bacterium]|nr:polymer-forming cytoskeletal protein [Anaerolineae bacterium]
MVRKVALSLILALFLWSLAQPAFAEGGKMLFGEDFTLRSGETYRGDVLIFGGNLVLEEGSHLEGNVVVFGGRAKVSGTLEGDLAVFGGDVKVESTGKIEGDVVVMGGRLVKEEGAVIEGEVTEEAPFLLPPVAPPYSSLRDFVNWLLWGSVRFMLTLIALIAASILIISLWPEQVKVIAETINKAPLESGGIGLGAVVLGVPAGLVLLLFACLGLLVWLALLIAGLFGLTALAYRLGEKVFESAGSQGLSPLLQVILGVALIQLLGLIPCLGFLLQLVIYSLGIGAVILSRAGTYRGYCEKGGPVEASSSSS